jgi:hypothetical protein
MNQTRTLRLIDYEYDEKRDLIKWKVRDETPDEEIQEYVLAWPGRDLAIQFGIKENLPADLIINFSEDMKKRPGPFFMKREVTAKVRNKEWFGDASEEKLQDAHQEVDYYPFKEVSEQIEEEKTNTDVVE